MPLRGHGFKIRFLWDFMCQAALCAVATSTAMSAGTPDSFAVYALHDTQSLAANCQPTDASNIRCDFSQTMVISPNNYDKFQAKLQEIDRFADSEIETPADCNDTQKFIKSLESGYPLPDFPQDYVDIEIFSDPILLSDSLAYYRSIERFCNWPTKESLIEMTIAGYKLESQACHIYTRSFQQDFRLGQNDDWISVSGPDILCGDVTISSLKMDNNSSSLWIYKTKKVSTSEKRSDLCGPPDPTEYVYNWKRNSYALQCRIIRFGL
jgi:hypothetical protein